MLLVLRCQIRAAGGGAVGFYHGISGIDTRRGRNRGRTPWPDSCRPSGRFAGRPDRNALLWARQASQTTVIRLDLGAGAPSIGQISVNNGCGLYTQAERHASPHLGSAPGAAANAGRLKPGNRKEDCKNRSRQKWKDRYKISFARLTKPSQFPSTQWRTWSSLAPYAPGPQSTLIERRPGGGGVSASRCPGAAHRSLEHWTGGRIDHAMPQARKRSAF